jgi:hypothetical protein
MSDTAVQTVTTEPAQVAQTTVEKKSGAANTSQSDFAKSIAAKQAPAFAKAVAEVKAEAPVTEEAKAPAEVPAEEPKTEAQADTAEATDPETDEVLSPERNNLDPKLQEKINRRIGKEVAKRKALEQEVASLKALVTAAPQEVEKEVHVSVPADVPLPEIHDMAALEQYNQTLSRDIREAEMMLYSDWPAEGKQTKWGHMTKDTLIASLVVAREAKEETIPAKRTFLQTQTQSKASALEKFPFLKDPTHAGYQMAKQALRENPVLRAYPNSDYLVGLIVKGQLADLAEAKPETKVAVKPKPKPTPGQSEIASDASISRAPTGVMNQQALQAEIEKITKGKKSLSAKEYSAVLAAKQRFRNSQ